MVVVLTSGTAASGEWNGGIGEVKGRLELRWIPGNSSGEPPSFGVRKREKILNGDLDRWRTGLSSSLEDSFSDRAGVRPRLDNPH